MMQSSADSAKNAAHCEELLIHPLAEKDIPAVTVIDHEAFGENAWSEDALRSELQRDDAVMFSALVNGEVAGYIGMRTVLDEGYVDNVAVAPRFRRHGIGRALVQALILAGRERALHFITLEVRISNEAALSLYQQMGFQDAGLRKGFYSFPKEDARLMTLYL